MSNEPLALEEAQSSVDRVAEAFGADARLRTFRAYERTYIIDVDFPCLQVKCEHEAHYAADQLGHTHKAWVTSEVLDTDKQIKADSWDELFESIVSFMEQKASEHQEAADACLDVVGAYHEH